MRRYCVQFVVAVSFGLLLFQSRLAAQEPNHASSARIIVGKDKVGTAAEAFIPLTFSASAADPVGTLNVEIIFPEGDLAFQELFPSDPTNADVTATATHNDTDPTMTHLRISIRAKMPPLRSGVLAKLTFKVSSSVAFGDKIPLKSSSQGLSAGPTARPVNVAAIDGEVDVSAVPGVYTCFFYMH